MCCVPLCWAGYQIELFRMLAKEVRLPAAVRLDTDTAWASDRVQLATIPIHLHEHRPRTHTQAAADRLQARLVRVMQGPCGLLVQMMFRGGM